jgi:hypothetical protein
MALFATQLSLEVWQPISWTEFVTIADDPAADKFKGYYHAGRMRFEPMSTGSDHSKDHTVIILGVGLYAALQKISSNSKFKILTEKPDILEAESMSPLRLRRWSRCH